MPFGIDLMPKLRGLGKRPLSLEVRIQPNIPDVVQWGNGAPRPLRSSYLHIPQHGPRGRDPRETFAQGDGHAISSATAAFTPHWSSRMCEQSVKRQLAAAGRISG